jgi:phosphoribulokinase
MSIKHPVIAVTGSSGAGTTSVKYTFTHIFRREGIKATFIEGDSYHRFDREEMKKAIAKSEENGGRPISHFGAQANLFGDIEQLFKEYGENGTGKVRRYLHDEDEAALFKQARHLHKLGTD